MKAEHHSFAGKLLALLWLIGAAQNARSETSPVAMDAFRDRIESSWRAQNAGAIEAARRELLASADERAAYFAAYARFRQGLLAASDAEAAARHVDDCIAELRAYIARRPGDAEARALLGSCYGVSTRYHRLGLASRGLEARRQMAAARGLAPLNPWVMLQDGLADEATPRLFGGDRAAAIAKLERAAALFESALREGSRTASWGAAETLLQLARMYREAGRAADAARALERAGSLTPSSAGPPAFAAS